MPRRQDKQEINASSMADIAFLLLVFFLVTTTMDTSWGISRRLPPKVDDVEIKIKMRNIFEVLANASDQLLVESKLMDISQLREAAKIFIVNPNDDKDMPEKEEINMALCNERLAILPEGKDDWKKWDRRKRAVEILGPYTSTKQVISLQNDRGTSYELYLALQNELAAAYRELRDDLSIEKFGISFVELAAKAKATKDPALKAKMKAIKTVYPQRISEAEPKAIGS